jgi:hypothetical protein
MKFIIGIFLTTFLVIGVKSFAQNAVCNQGDAQINMDVNGDVTCQALWGKYTKDSAATAQAKVAAQGIGDQKTAIAQQQQVLNQQALQEVIANQIANDPKLAARQVTITKSLNALQTK